MVSPYLAHYGVKGMRWGVRKDRVSSSVNIKSGRLNIFGTSDHNILYLTGISGSGKSTLALNLAKKLDAEPINLDWYYGLRSYKTPFKKFLQDNGVDFKNLHKNNKLNYSESDKIFPLLKEYSKDHRLIVEGVQLLDNTMQENMREILLKEPIISIQTSARVSFNRASNRDGAATIFVNSKKARKMQDIFDNDLMLSIGEAYAQTLLEN